MKNVKAYKESFINQPQNFGEKDFRYFLSKVHNFSGRASASATADALRFYLDEDILSDIQRHYSDRATLPDNLQYLLSDMHECQSVTFYRIFFYLLCIVHNEARHASDECEFPVEEYVNNDEDASSFLTKYSVFRKLEDESNKEFAQYLYEAFTLEQDFSTGSRSRNDLIICRLSNDYAPYNISLSDMLDRYYSLFCHYYWEYEFGGNSWGELVKLMIDVSSGKITPKIFIDSAFSQEHNNGMIFDKEVIYRYDESNIASEMQAILNAQSMGLIPKLILSDYKFGEETKINTLIQYIKDNYPSYMSLEMNEMGDNFILILEGE